MIKKTLKNILFVISFLLYLTAYSLSEINSKEWTTECVDIKNENKASCLSIIISQIKNNDKMQTIATAYIQIGSTKQKKMNLINKDDQTYKLSEENKIVPILFVKLPLNVNLKKKPAIVIDDKKLADLTFSFCNQTDGCVSNILLNDGTVDFFKKGKIMSVVVGTYGNNENLKIDFPLKNFSKSYTQLLKK